MARAVQAHAAATRSSGRAGAVLPGHPFDEARLDDALLGVLVIAGNQTWEDAFDVADRCIAQWDAFLRDHGLH